MTKFALITGITGQDGSYLAELLLEKGYEVHGIVRPTARNTMGNLKVADQVTLHEYDMMGGDQATLWNLLRVAQPDEVYNLAAQSHVGTSFAEPFATHRVNAVGAHLLMQNVFFSRGPTRFYQASTSELYGDVNTRLQNESTRFNPVSPYGISKQYAYETVRMFRRRGHFACNGILFNHESPRRHPYFVTRKVSMAVAQIAAGQQSELCLGNLDAQRDWGHAKDYVKGMWMMMQQDEPDDYVLATGETHSVRKFVTTAFKVAGIDIRWWDTGKGEVGVDAKTGVTRVRVDPQFYRPSEVNYLCGDASKARKVFGWRPSFDFDDLVYDMVHTDMVRVARGD